MEVGEAIKAMREGKLLSRRGWEKTFGLTVTGGDFRDHKGTYYSIYPMDAHDLLADDWYVVGEAVAQNLEPASRAPSEPPAAAPLPAETQVETQTSKASVRRPKRVVEETQTTPTSRGRAGARRKM